MNADYRCKYLKNILFPSSRTKRNDLDGINISRPVIASSENKAPRKDHLRLFQQMAERIARVSCWSSWRCLASISGRDRHRDTYGRGCRSSNRPGSFSV
jgi:hypothetical protein